MADEPKGVNSMTTVRLGDSFSAGYWSGRRVTFRRANTAYACRCGDPAHAILPGDVYLVVTPDRMASWQGTTFTHRINVAHANHRYTVVDKQGGVVATIGPQENATQKK